MRRILVIIYLLLLMNIELMKILNLKSHKARLFCAILSLSWDFKNGCRSPSTVGLQYMPHRNQIAISYPFTHSLQNLAAQI